MRTVLTMLLAFAAGLVLMPLLRSPFASMARVDVPAHVAPASVPAASTTATKPASTGAYSNAQWPLSAPSPEQVLYAQKQMVDTVLAGMTPRVSGRPNLYLVAFAGDGGESVFRNEAEYAARLFAQRFGATAHSVVLENNPATLATHPLASFSNLELTLDGLAKVMHPDQDILMLYLTSHGSEDHYLLVDMDPLPLDQIGSKDLAGILAEHHFRWKVVVVNACYSGGFIPPLKGPGSLVITAARSDRSSFGCGSESNITDFGRAFLVDGLNHSDRFVDAFTQARTEVGSWEKRDKFTPSQPQIAIGSGIEHELALWRHGITAGPAVPFEPAELKRGTATMAMH